MNPPPDGRLLRLLDANANRAREGLRVVEDYARFVLDDADLSRELKEIRHEVATATGGFVAEAILHRDTAGDVGTGVKVSSELHRTDVSAVVVAAGKRVGEAFRGLEEYLKVLAPEAAARVEAARYRFYDVETRLARTLRPTGASSPFSHVRLYVVVTESACRGDWLRCVQDAIRGGADCVQLREKGMDGGELLRRARELVEFCRKHRVLCVINDRPDIAVLSDADGVHVGQTDLPATEARKVVGNGRIVGVSTHNLEQAKQAVLDGADYIGVGPIYRSPTKPRDFVAGLEYARQVARAVPQIPAVAIAGITAANVDEVLATGVPAVAVTSAVLGAPDVRAAAAELKRKLVAGAKQAVAQTFLSVSGGHGEAVAQTFLSVSGGHSCPPTAPDDAVRIQRRNLPHWTLRGGTYYVTFRLHRDVKPLDPTERALVLSHLRDGDGKFYDLFAAVVMPDHVHCVLRPREGIELARIMKGTKGVSARLVNEARGARGTLWQDESWDRIVRDQNELEEKVRYMLDNPVRKGLVADGWDYDGWYVNQQAYQP